LQENHKEREKEPFSVI